MTAVADVFGDNAIISLGTGIPSGITADGSGYYIVIPVSELVAKANQAAPDLPVNLIASYTPANFDSAEDAFAAIVGACLKYSALNTKSSGNQRKFDVAFNGLSFDNGFFETGVNFKTLGFNSIFYLPSTLTEDYDPDDI